MCMSLGKNQGTALEPIIREPGKLLCEMNQEVWNQDLFNRNKEKYRAGDYIVQKARFKGGHLEACIAPEKGPNSNEKAFWTVVEESFEWEPVLNMVKNGSVRVTGGPMRSKEKKQKVYMEPDQ